MRKILYVIHDGSVNNFSHILIVSGNRRALLNRGVLRGRCCGIEFLMKGNFMARSNRRSRDEWKKIIEQQVSSGQSARAFCEAGSIGLAGFINGAGGLKKIFCS